MSRSVKWRKVRNSIFVYALLTIIAVIVSLPFVWLLATSLQSANRSIYQFPQSLLPTSPTLANYRRALGLLDFSRTAFNSLFITMSIVVLTVIVCSLAAYPLARLKFMGNRTIFGLIMVTFMVPFQALMVPLYVVVVNLGMIDSYSGAIFPVACNAFGILFLRQAFDTIPLELEEAARMDGCTDLTIWYHIFVPLIKPSIAALAVLEFVQQWNGFLWPMIVLSSEELFPLQIKLLTLTQGVFQGNWRDITAAAALTMIPVLTVFFLLQGYFLEGDMTGALKG